MSLLHRLYGSAVIAAHLPGQAQFPFSSRKRIEALRDRRIRRMVAYAAAHTPYYRTLFAREGIDPRVIRTAADLDRLPLTEKQTVRSQPDLFLADTAQGRAALSFLTSGSTGQPTRVHHDRHSLLCNIAWGERERDPQIKAAGSFRPTEVYIGNETAVIRDVTAFYNANTLMPRPRRRFVSVLTPIEEVAALVNDRKPDLLVGYGGWIDQFFKTVAARGLEIHRPKMALYMAEALPHGGREFIEEAFGVPVLSRYSAAEAFKIGYVCECRSGFHLHEDLTHLRIVRPDGTSADPGESGEIVISNLVNRGSVLLNYRIGDVGSIDPSPCACGRTLKRLSELEGRVEDIVTLPDGGFVHPRAFWEVFKHDPRILQYQIVQTELRRFELELTTIDDAAFAEAYAAVKPRLSRILGEDAVIEASRRGEYDRSEGKKFRAVSSRVKRPR